MTGFRFWVHFIFFFSFHFISFLVNLVVIFVKFVIIIYHPSPKHFHLKKKKFYEEFSVFVSYVFVSSFVHLLSSIIIFFAWKEIAFPFKWNPFKCAELSLGCQCSTPGHINSTGLLFLIVLDRVVSRTSELGGLDSGHANVLNLAT